MEQIKEARHPHLGPLTSTFLLAMAMPIINLPIERIERHGSDHEEGYADDRKVDAFFTAAVMRALRGGPLKNAPFYSQGAWRFADWPTESGLNLASSLPEQLATDLASEAASLRADSMEASKWASVLRNALAHGGIAYLDEDGRSTYNKPVKMFAFVSGKYDKADREKIIGVNVLRISEVDFRVFLRRWVEWLRDSRLAETLAA